MSSCLWRSQPIAAGHFVEMSNWLRYLCVVQSCGHEDVFVVHIKIQVKSHSNIMKVAFLCTRYAGLFILSSLDLLTLLGQVVGCEHRLALVSWVHLYVFQCYKILVQVSSYNVTANIGCTVKLGINITFILTILNVKMRQSCYQSVHSGIFILCYGGIRCINSRSICISVTRSTVFDNGSIAFKTQLGSMALHSCLFS